VTGLAQVSGRNAISWEDKFKLDVWYVDHQSFWLDGKILLLTVKKVLLSEGVSAEGEATMSRFTGNNT
jgi:lipopolysaccharide/colanic/teichoic acid biosynthesis glycosyltransferase